MTGLALACNTFPERAGNLEALNNRQLLGDNCLEMSFCLGVGWCRRLSLTSWHEAATFRLCSGLVWFRGCSKLALELLSSVSRGCNESDTFAKLRCSVEGRISFQLTVNTAEKDPGCEGPAHLVVA